MSCKICGSWACEDVRRVLLTGHHPRCPKAPDALGEAFKLIAELATALRAWGAEEDGIPDMAWGAYRKAMALQGVFLPECGEA